MFVACRVYILNTFHISDFLHMYFIIFNNIFGFFQPCSMQQFSQTSQQYFNNSTQILLVTMICSIVSENSWSYTTSLKLSVNVLWIILYLHGRLQKALMPLRYEYLLSTWNLHELLINALMTLMYKYLLSTWDLHGPLLNTLMPPRDEYLLSILHLHMILLKALMPLRYAYS